MKSIHYGYILIIVLIIGTQSFAQEVDPITIDNYTAEPSALLTELEIQGLIPSGAEEAFIQGEFSFSGERSQFSTFALDNRANNLVMGATLTLSATADALEFCGIGLNVQRVEENRFDEAVGSNITTIRLTEYLTIGIDNEGTVFAVERQSDAGSGLVLSEEQVDLDEAVYLLAILLNDTVSVYANGELMLADYPVTLAAGAFAFLFSGQEDATQCDADLLFAYTFADDLVDGCLVSTDSPVNQRAGAGTEFARVTQLQPNAPLQATGQTVGSDGFIWWYLEDDTWVRSDVVDTTGFCRILPETDGTGG